MGRTRLKTLRLPPHIRYSVPWRAWVMLEAMQPSREEAPTAAARSSTSTWTAGEIVAQLIKVVPLALANRESPEVAKIERTAASSVTTVMTTSERAVTSARVLGAAQLSSLASLRAARLLASDTAEMLKPLSLRLRAYWLPCAPRRQSRLKVLLALFAFWWILFLPFCSPR